MRSSCVLVSATSTRSSRTRMRESGSRASVLTTSPARSIRALLPTATIVRLERVMVERSVVLMVITPWEMRVGLGRSPLGGDAQAGAVTLPLEAGEQVVPATAADAHEYGLFASGEAAHCGHGRDLTAVDDGGLGNLAAAAHDGDPVTGGERCQVRGCSPAGQGGGGHGVSPRSAAGSAAGQGRASLPKAVISSSSRKCWFFSNAVRQGVPSARRRSMC